MRIEKTDLHRHDNVLLTEVGNDQGQGRQTELINRQRRAAGEEEAEERMFRFQAEVELEIMKE